MSECPDHRAAMENLLAGEITPADREALNRHCATCPECRQLAALHGILNRVGEDLPEPSAAEFDAMREQVLLDVRQRPVRRAWGRFWRDLAALLRSHRIAAPASLATLAALLAVAVFAGRWTAAPAGPENLAGGGPADKADPAGWFSLAGPKADAALVQAIQVQADGHESLGDLWDSPLAFTNVVARPNADGTLALSFDVCRHVDMVADRTSPVTREVLLHAILNPSALGNRLQAMALAPEMADPALREALVVTLHNDPSPVVRMKAVTELSRLPFDPPLREALLQTLRQDPSVQMRLLALETLAAQRVELDLLRRTILEAGQESDPAVLQLAGQIGEGL